MIERHRQASTEPPAAPASGVARPARRSPDGAGLSTEPKPGVKPWLPARFQVKHELGRGGVGAVYRVYDRTAGHEVALKTLHGVSVEDRLSLKTEFRALSDIIHPNIVDLYELVIDERACFFTMELVQGMDLARHVQELRRQMPDRGAWHAQFRDVARQLALALQALHQGDKLHRDIKPTNVLVTNAGRVVLVDFGLAISTTREAPLERDEIDGTFLYMSPEQLAGRPLSPASDWYSFGVTLYEALSGEPPSPRETVAWSVTPQSLRARGFDVKPELDELVRSLRAFDPGDRPDASEILLRLGSRSAVEAPTLSVAPLVPTPELIGRDAELSRLLALSELEKGVGPRVVRLLGPSGIGKTSLVDAFFDKLGRHPGTLLLKSRCHPQEAVVFNAVDGIVDGLSNEVEACLSPDERVLPDELHAALTRVFPVLASSLTTAPSMDGSRSDDREKRYLAFLAFREVLKRLSAHMRVVVWLDDVQWGDEDSGTLLLQLLRASDCPPLLLLLSYRSEDENASPCLRVLRDDCTLWNSTVAVPVRPLDEDESREIVSKQLGSDWKGDAQVRDALFRSAGGSPFLLTELGRYLSANPGGTEAPGEARTVGLDEILRLRTQGLPGDCRTLLGVLAVAGAPVEQRLLLLACGLGLGARGLLRSLERLLILRTTDMQSQRIEFYHDKLRQEVLQQLGAEARAAYHRSLGHAFLDASVPQPLAAIDHFEAAGDSESLRRYVVAAANHALKLLAFERAARLFQRAIDLEPGDVPLHELYRRLGSALGSAGRGPDAGVAYSAAARLLRSDPGARAEEVAQLHQKAAEQFIQTGHFQQGVAIVRSVLSDLHVPFPDSRGRALATAGLLRVASLVTGYRPRAPRRPPSEAELRRFDALWAACTRLAMVDYALTSYASARCARDAMKLGEPSRMSRAVAMEASFFSLFPQAIFQRRALALLELAEDLARGGDNVEYDSLFATSSRAIISFYRGEFRVTWTLADRASAGLNSYSPGHSWEEAPWQMWSLLGLALNGELRELIRRVHRAREDAARRDDRHVEQNICLGAPSVVWLALDVVDDAKKWADRALSWAPSAYTAQHYQHYVTLVDYDLYLGDGLSAWQRTLDTWPAHRREGFLSLTFIRDDLLRSRGRSALAAALALTRTGRRRTPSGHSSSELLEDARRAAQSMKRHRLLSATGFGLLLESALHRAAGRRRDSAASLESAVDTFDRAEMQLYREVARYCLGDSKPLASRAPERARAERWMREQGVKNPPRLVESLAPGFS